MKTNAETIPAYLPGAPDHHELSARHASVVAVFGFEAIELAEAVGVGVESAGDGVTTKSARGVIARNARAVARFRLVVAVSIDIAA